MLRVNIDNDDRDVHIACPHCEHCESHPVDEQRHHIQTFDLEWLEDEGEWVEVSKMKCHVCKEEFELTWNYREATLQEKLREIWRVYDDAEAQRESGGKGDWTDNAEAFIESVWKLVVE